MALLRGERRSLEGVGGRFDGRGLGGDTASLARPPRALPVARAMPKSTPLETYA